LMMDVVSSRGIAKRKRKFTSDNIDINISFWWNFRWRYSTFLFRDIIEAVLLVNNNINLLLNSWVVIDSLLDVWDKSCLLSYLESPRVGCDERENGVNDSLMIRMVAFKVCLSKVKSSFIYSNIFLATVMSYQFDKGGVVNKVIKKLEIGCYLNCSSCCSKSCSYLFLCVLRWSFRW
jgi:hypothetical protein